MRLFVLLMLLILPCAAQLNRGFENWTSPLFTLIVWIENRPENVVPYLWIYNATSKEIELDPNTVTMVDNSGNSMARSLQQVATYSRIGPGQSSIMYPLFWKNPRRSPAEMSFRTADGTKYIVSMKTGMTSQGPFEKLERPLREAVKDIYKSKWNEPLSDRGTLKQVPKSIWQAPGSSW